MLSEVFSTACRGRSAVPSSIQFTVQLDQSSMESANNDRCPCIVGLVAAIATLMGSSATLLCPRAASPRPLLSQSSLSIMSAGMMSHLSWKPASRCTPDGQLCHPQLYYIMHVLAADDPKWQPLMCKEVASSYPFQHPERGLKWQSSNPHLNFINKIVHGSVRFLFFPFLFMNPYNYLSIYLLGLGMWSIK